MVVIIRGSLDIDSIGGSVLVSQRILIVTQNGRSHEIIDEPCNIGIQIIDEVLDTSRLSNKIQMLSMVHAIGLATKFMAFQTTYRAADQTVDIVTVCHCVDYCPSHSTSLPSHLIYLPTDSQTWLY